jgi:hypothetical protein
VLRRELLAGAAGLAGASALGLQKVGQGQPADPAGGFDDALYGGAVAEPVPLAVLRAATVSARADFQTARYGRLARAFPG